MEHAIVSLIAIAIILGGTVTLVFNAISPVDTIATSWKQMTQTTEYIMRTDISGINASVPQGDLGAKVEITVNNQGQVSLYNYDSWDVVIQYYSDNVTRLVKWLPYTTSLADNTWTVGNWEFNGSPETFDPEILNPGENMQVRMQLDPPVATNTTNMVTISTSNGVPTRVIFERGDS